MKKTFVKLAWMGVLVFAFVWAARIPALAMVNAALLGRENFSHWPAFGLNETWRYFAINGNGQNISVNGPISFDNSTADLTQQKELQFTQVYDPDFDAEAPYQYNNIFMIGFQGHEPTVDDDVVWEFDFKTDPNTYGTTGFMLEPVNTFGPDGHFLLPFTLFGLSYSGPENYNAGLQCSSVIDWIPVSEILINDVDPFEWNHYEIRLHELNTGSVLASMTVNNITVCETTIGNWGPTEVQIWLDNYKITLDPNAPLGYVIGFNNKPTPQNSWFDNISVKTKPAN